MIKVGVIGSDNEAMEILLKRAKSEIKEAIEFIRFDGENIEKQALAAAHEADIGELDILMKGIVPTRTVLRAVLSEEFSLKEKKLLSHVAIIHLPTFERTFLITDPGMNIQPSIEELKIIIENAIDLAINMGIETPKVALLSAAENENPNMPSAVNAFELTDYYSDREDAIIYGPLSLDLALSKDSVENKRFKGPVAGEADIVVVPTIDAGNILYKALQLFAEVEIGGLVLGAKIPIIIPSRSDSTDSKLFALRNAIHQVKGKR